MMRLVDWSPKLDLTTFYEKAEQQGITNNSNQAAMVDCFRNEKEFKVWILYDNDNAIGSVAAHSFDEVMGSGSYRILSRVCVLQNTNRNLVTVRYLISQHQSINDQIFLPTCIKWANTKNLYATSNENLSGSQRLVHNVYFPTLEKIGLVKRIGEINYRNTDQTVWKINVDAFEEDLNRYPRWDYLGCSN